MIPGSKVLNTMTARLTFRRIACALLALESISSLYLRGGCGSGAFIDKSVGRRDAIS